MINFQDFSELPMLRARLSREENLYVSRYQNQNISVTECVNFTKFFQAHPDYSVNEMSC